MSISSILPKQLKLAAKAERMSDIPVLMNSIVKPCLDKPKFLGMFKRATHTYDQDLTTCLNTITYTLLLRCSDCGHTKLVSGL